MSNGSDASVSKPVRVLIIDDSITIRRLLRLVLAADEGIEIVGEAENPLEARELIKKTDPDVLTLDVEMPKMDGLEFLRRLMRLRPMPVVMISTLTHKGSEAAVTALGIGAFDVFGKPLGADVSEWRAIVPIVKAAARAQVSQPRVPTQVATPKRHGPWSGKILAIGASTGGVDALETVLSGFPGDCPPTLIVQHMPALFLESLAGRLNSKYLPTVELAQHGTPLSPGHVYIAPGGETHLHIHKSSLKIDLVKGDKVSGHRPSVDVLFQSLALRAKDVVAALLTGMGRDGALGLGELHAMGATTIAQDEATCVVYGMPRAAVESGAADHVLPLTKIADKMLSEAERPAARRSARA